MIPQKKKTPEEIAALREGLGISPLPSEQPPHPAPTAAEPIFHKEDSQPDPAPPIHSLRKHDLALAPAPVSSHRTELPTSRHDSRDINQIRKREALAKLQHPSIDPVAHILRQTASPFLYIPGYLLAVAAAVSASQSVLYITPAVLLGLSTIIILYIAWRKPRSRHHAALLFILVFMTFVFSALHYAPFLKNAP